MPLIVVNGQLPEQLQRTFTKLKTLIEKSSIVLAEADNLLEKVRYFKFFSKIENFRLKPLSVKFLRVMMT